MSEQSASGQTVAAFCRERGIPASQLYAWKRRLRQAAAEPFVEMQIVGASPRRPAAHRAMEVRLSSGHSILVEPGFDAGHLRAVVAVLEGRA